MARKEVWFEELGYFCKSQLERLKTKMDGKTYMNFKVIYSNEAGNCTLGVVVSGEYEKEEIKSMFIHCVMSELSEMIRESQNA